MKQPACDRKLPPALSLFLFLSLTVPGPLSSQDFRFLGLSHAANMGFADEVENDGTGGWTDQGPGIDLKDFPVGRREFLGIPFKVIDPKKNGGRSVVVLAGRDRPDLPLEAVIPGDQARGAVLYFLHTCAWGGTSKSRTVAEYEVLYTDGSKETLPLRVGVEFTNWWGIREGDACEVAWVHESGGIRRGVNLFAWKNPHPGLAIESLTLRSFKKMPVPILLAVTVAAEDAELEKPVVKAVKEVHGEWPALGSPSGEEQVPAFDLRQVRDFKDERYWGITADLESLSVEPELLERRAAYWAAWGCNLVRIVVSPKMRGSHGAGKNPILSPDNLDSLRRAVLVLEKAGIRAYLDRTSDLSAESGDGPDPSTPEQGISETFFLKPEGCTEGVLPDRIRPEKSGTLSFTPGPVVMDPEGSFVLRLAGMREHGKPFLARWSAEFPNEYAAERPILASWAAVFQGWKGCVTQETLGPSGEKQLPGDAGTMPVFRAHFPAAALACRRGDLKTAQARWICGDEGSCGSEGLAHAAGRKSGGLSRTDNVGVDTSMVHRKNRTVTTDTGQTVWRGNIGVFLVDAPRFQAAAGFLANRKIRNHVWNIETSNEFAVLSAVSLTKTGITRSDRVLITGVARAANTGMEFNRKGDECLSLGDPPVRVEPLKATLVLHRLKPEPVLRVRALDLDGQPLRQPVRTRWSNNDLYLTWVPGAAYLEVYRP